MTLSEQDIAAVHTMYGPGLSEAEALRIARENALDRLDRAGDAGPTKASNPRDVAAVLRDAFDRGHRFVEALNHAGDTLAGDEAENLHPFADSLYELPDYHAAPAPQSFHIERYLPAGLVGVLAGDGDVGKTQLNCQEAVCLALGVPFLGFKVTGPRTIVMVTAEDDGETLWRKLRQVHDGLGFGQCEWRIVRERVVVVDIRGRGVSFVESPSNGRFAANRDALMELTATVINRFTTPDVIYVDTVSKTLGFNEEGGPAKAYVDALEMLSNGFQSTPTVKFTHHVGKENGKRGNITAGGVRGASQFVDNARFTHMLAHLVREKGGNRGAVREMVAAAPERVLPFLRILSVPRVKGAPPAPPTVIEAVPLDLSDWQRGFSWRVYVPSIADHAVARQEREEHRELEHREVRDIIAAQDGEWLSERALRGKGLRSTALPERLAAAVAAGWVEMKEESGRKSYRALRGAETEGQHVDRGES